MRIRATITTTTALLALTTLAACSSSNDDKTAPSTPTVSTPSSEPSPAEAPTNPSTNTSTAALEKAVRDYTAALFNGTESGHDYLSARCKKQMDKAAWTTMAKGAHQQYGSQKATNIRVDQISGDLARVSYGAGNIPQFEREGQSWTREGGTWRWDACPSTG